MPRLLKELRIDDVSSVDVGAGRGVKVVLTKRKADAMSVRELISADIAAGRNVRVNVVKEVKEVKEVSDMETVVSKALAARS